jgi:putative nucleotidyltransferase with HDIG domain
MTAQRSGDDRGRDGLTGLYAESALPRALESGSVARQQRRPLGALLMAIDGLDGAGERTLREALLRSLATVVHESSRPADLGFRRSDDGVLVLRPGATLLGVWLWAEDVLHRYARLWAERGGLEEPARLSIGALSFPSEEAGPEMIGLLEGALQLAQRDGGGVRTWDWVEIDGALGQAEATNLDPEGRRRRFLEYCTHLLGTCQRHDVIDHCGMVSETAVVLARILGLDEILIEQIRLAGLLHDIGKCVIPEELLARPTSLSHREWALMARHPEWGAAMAMRLGVGAWTAECIRRHHGRYDAIEWAETRPETPLAARVLCVVDALVSMTSPRPYREALDLPMALAELSRGSGTQFDPRVVAAARRLAPAIMEARAA